MGFVVRFVIWLLELYAACVVVYALLSWAFALNLIPKTQPVALKVWDFLYKAVEPALARIRVILPPTMTLDLSPVALFVAIIVVQGFLRAFF
ncbi:MAG: YggT family protein [Methylobacteriaceae bacterium]|jgi:uncharacterized protein YggT (Ycf19 family)|nr:YggT family protein [Methylobacteriaceae bacterium]